MTMTLRVEFGKETDNAVCFGREEILDNGFCLIGDKVVRRINGRDEREVLDINNIFIPGMHNVRELYWRLPRRSRDWLRTESSAERR